MDFSIRFRINTPDVVHEMFDGETVVVNLDTGIYYSLEETAADIWSLIKKGASLGEILEALTDLYRGENSNIQNSVEQFLSELEKDFLIVIDESNPSRSLPETPTRKSAERPLFEAPALKKYTDMQDLLLLDPIHEVDESGWPGSKSDPKD